MVGPIIAAGLQTQNQAVQQSPIGTQNTAEQTRTTQVDQQTGQDQVQTTGSDLGTTLESSADFAANSPETTAEQPTTGEPGSLFDETV